MLTKTKNKYIDNLALLCFLAEGMGGVSCDRHRLLLLCTPPPPKHLHTILFSTQPTEPASFAKPVQSLTLCDCDSPSVQFAEKGTTGATGPVQHPVLFGSLTQFIVPALQYIVSIRDTMGRVAKTHIFAMISTFYTSL